MLDLNQLPQPKCNLCKTSISNLFPAIDYSREEFQQTLAVAGSVRGRAPVICDGQHIICVDQKGGMNISVYKYEEKFQHKCNLEVV